MAKRRSRVDRSRVRQLIMRTYSMGHVSRHSSWSSAGPSITAFQDLPETVGLRAPSEDYKTERLKVRVRSAETGRTYLEYRDIPIKGKDGKFIVDKPPKSQIKKGHEEAEKTRWAGSRHHGVTEWFRVTLLNGRFNKFYLFHSGELHYFVSEVVFPEYILKKRSMIYREPRARTLQRYKSKDIYWTEQKRYPRTPPPE